MNSKIIEGISYIKSSKNRIKIVITLNTELKIPSEISSETKIRLNHVSKLLSELKEKNIVECLNENDKKGRLYHLTDYGLELYDYIK
ncbi:MarR family transcriptional regulator [uncultured Methanosphaera sp.]|uniref:MarR family transcriptional regulator n=1 Tax=uncultured Methanosphaera sp. TaxID=262501 RepID=UPI0025951F45|nr:MarR family transcriptional regulator [uncultured Methanosphaera sp.]